MIKRTAVLATFLLCVIITVSIFPAFGITLVRSKSETISNFKALCDAHRDVASYESLGKALLGEDIWIFKFGNPTGGRVLWDCQLHGGEDMGSEIMWMFVQWLVNSNDPQAKLYLQRNYLLVIPVVNVDSYDRGNMRRQYVLNNGDVVDVLYGVDLNRNFPVGWGSYGTSDPASWNYMGLYGGSEPETRVLTAAFRKYKPTIHVNTHSWAGPIAWISGNAGIINAITQSQSDYFVSVKPTYNGVAISPYTIEVSGFAGGTCAGQSNGMYTGTTSCLIELNPKSDQFQPLQYQSTPLYAIQQYYYPKILGFLRGTLDATAQNPYYGSIDFDCTMDNQLLNEPTTYEVTFPNASIKSYYRAGGLIYNCPEGAYSVRVVVNNNAQTCQFSVLASSQTKVVMRFGSTTGAVVSIIPSSSASPALPSTSTFVDGFESGLSDDWKVTRTLNDQVQLSSEQAVSGAYSVKCYVDDKESAGEMAYVSREIAPTREVYVRTYVRFSSLPISGSWCPINVRAQLNNPGALAWLELRRTSLGVVWTGCWRDSYSTMSEDLIGVSINANRWYYVELYVKVDSSGMGEVDIWIDGILVLHKSGISNGEWLGGVQYVQFGERWASPYSGTHSVYVDCIEVSIGHSVPSTSLSVQVYDMATAGEFQLLVNGDVVYTNPSDPSKVGVFATLNFDITSYVNFGSNVVVFRNPISACCRTYGAQIIVGGVKVVDDQTITTLQLSEKQYSFNI